jgi:hypothetical protein
MIALQVATIAFAAGSSTCGNLVSGQRQERPRGCSTRRDSWNGRVFWRYYPARLTHCSVIAERVGTERIGGLPKASVNALLLN